MTSPTTPTTYLAPTATKPITGTITVPGSKSMTNRAWILSALADSPSRIDNALRSRDTDLMRQAITSLGTTVTQTSETTYHITPTALKGNTIHCGLAGTIMRFIPPLAVLAQGTTLITGDTQAKARPITVTLQALRQLGAHIEGDHLPFTIHSQGTFPGGDITIDASSSSQFLSGLLLSAASYDQGITVHHHGDPIPSQPHIDMTTTMVTSAQGNITTGNNSWTVKPGPLIGKNWHIEPDLSNASVFLAAALVTNGSITIKHWPTHSLQPSAAIIDLFEKFGATITFTEQGLQLHGSPTIHGVTRNLSDIGELTPTAIAIAALAEEPSQFTGIAHLSGHETNRLAALRTEINALGGHCTELADGLEIIPRPLHEGLWHTYADHRMATAGAIIGLQIPGIEIEDITATTKTLPTFTTLWEGLIAQ